MHMEEYCKPIYEQARELSKNCKSFINFYFLENDFLDFSKSFWIASTSNNLLEFSDKTNKIKKQENNNDIIHIYLYTMDIPLCYIENFDYQEEQTFAQAKLKDDTRRFFLDLLKSIFQEKKDKKEYLFIKKSLLYLLKGSESSKIIRENLKKNSSITMNFFNERDWLYETVRYPCENNLDCILYTLNSFLFLYRELIKIREYEKIKYLFQNMILSIFHFDKDYILKEIEKKIFIDYLRDLDFLYKKYEINPIFVYASSHDINYNTFYNNINQGNKASYPALYYNLSLVYLFNRILQEKGGNRYLVVYSKSLPYQIEEEFFYRLLHALGDDGEELICYKINLDREYNESKIYLFDFTNLYQRGGEVVAKIILDDYKAKYNKNNEMKYFDYWFENMDYYKDIGRFIEKLLGEGYEFLYNKIYRVKKNKR